MPTSPSPRGARFPGAPRPTRRAALVALSSFLGAACFEPRVPAAVRQEPSESAPDDAALAAVIEGHTEFALALHRALVAQDPGANVFASPHSVWTALGMLREGAAGETREELDAALGVRAPAEGRRLAASPLRVGVAALRDRLAEVAGVLTTADAAWADRSLELRPPALEALASIWGAALERADFRGAPDDERRRINDWVLQRTRGRIAELLPAGSVTSLTRLVLTDAIHFKATWRTPFAAERTQERVFRRLDGAESMLPQMQLDEPVDFPRARLEDASAGVAATLVELPYSGDRLAFVALVPDAYDGLPALEAWLSAARLREAFASARPARLGLVMPKLSLAPRYRLGAPLGALGVRRAFDASSADFSRLSETEGPSLWVDEAYHAAFLEVDEDGTEAAAATGGVLRATSVGAELRLDRPFAFLIRERSTGAVLFLGRYTGSAAGE